MYIPEATENKGNVSVDSGAPLIIMSEDVVMITPSTCWGKPLMGARSVTRGAKCRILRPTDNDTLHGLGMPFREICYTDLE